MASSAANAFDTDAEQQEARKKAEKQQAAKGVAVALAAISDVVDLDSDTIDFSSLPNILDLELTDHLVRVLSSNETVTGLDVSNNTITSDIADRIGQLLTVNPNLRSLTMVNCKLSDSSASTIFRCCRKFRSIRCLNVSRNPKVGNIALAELDKVIQSSAVISEIHLLDTGVSFEGAIQVVEAMVSNTSLTFVALPFVVGHLLLAEVEKILERNWRLLQHADRAAKTVEALQSLAEKEEELKRTKWKVPPAPDAGCSHRIKTVTASREEWVDPTAKVHLMYLSLLDRKAQFDNMQKAEREQFKKLTAPTAIIRSPRSDRSSSHSGRSHSQRALVVAGDRSASPRDSSRRR